MVVERTEYKLVTAIKRRSIKPLFSKKLARVEMKPGEMIILNPQDVGRAGTVKAVIMHRDIPNTIRFVTQSYSPDPNGGYSHTRSFSEEQINDPRHSWHKKISFRPDPPELEK